VDELSTDIARSALDAAYGQALGWDELTYVLKGTGRLPLSDADRRSLGPEADRFPLFG
jgi:hypothetical protein